MKKLDISSLCSREIRCSCGRTHHCPISSIDVGRGALDRLTDLMAPYRRIVLAADANTFAVCGERVRSLLGDRLESCLVYRPDGLLVPDEDAVGKLEAQITPETDFILGVGSGVINDICKYTSWKHGLEYAIVATAPSMDGYASSGAAMITDGMKVTYTTHPPRYIVADVDVVKQAPLDMIRAGYGDIIGKYSSLNDWKLSHLVNGEHFCQEIYDLVLDVTDDIRNSADDIIARKDEAIEALTNALILIGVTLSLLGSTRPGSGSEHHLSHFFEIVGLVRGEPYFIHGTDVAYSAIITADIREKIAAMEAPCLCPEPEARRHAAWQRIYGRISGEVVQLQESAGSYRRSLQPVYQEKWPEIRAILKECPSAAMFREMLERVGYPLDAFENLYGPQKIADAKMYGKDLKDRYSVLWLYYEMFSGKKESI